MYAYIIKNVLNKSPTAAHLIVFNARTTHALVGPVTLRELIIILLDVSQSGSSVSKSNPRSRVSPNNAPRRRGPRARPITAAPPRDTRPRHHVDVVERARRTSGASGATTAASASRARTAATVPTLWPYSTARRPRPSRCRRCGPRRWRSRARAAAQCEGAYTPTVPTKKVVSRFFFNFEFLPSF